MGVGITWALAERSVQPNQQPCPQTDLALIDILSNRGFRTEMEPESTRNTDVYLGAAKGGRKRAQKSPQHKPSGFV